MVYAASAPPLDLALILAVDCSSSVDVADYRLQMDGIAAALRNPAVAEAIRAGASGRIAIMIVEWSARGSQAISLPWRILSERRDIEAAAGETGQLKRIWRPGGTGLADAIVFCASLLAAFTRRASRMVIDVSGDGEDNEGGDTASARDGAVAIGITINGLPIVGDSRLLEDYYRDTVIGGPGAFLLPAQNLLSFREVMARKLIREISTATA